MKLNFNNSYTQLNAKLFSRVNPTPVSEPKVLLFNSQLANQLGIETQNIDLTEIAQFLSGNTVLENSEPIAQAYAGHQFGHFTMLGDGRAILLGEHITPNNQRIDIQLKGAGRTPYSRNGDGRATLRAMLREYLISEAMYGLKIPTSRSLAVVLTGENVRRETIQQGAVLTRIAASHIRVGTFEFVSNFLSLDELNAYLDYVIQRHYTHLNDSKNKALDLLKEVIKVQIDLIVNWMRVGFIHGVMNTDNMSVAGETFDYGPCAFMNSYNPKTVFSAIDTNGRYAFSNQPKIALWNLSCFAETLLPLMDADIQQAIKLAEEELNKFNASYQQKFMCMMANKLGFEELDAQEEEIIHELLSWMEQNKADYTQTFILLQTKQAHTGIYEQEQFKNWHKKWLALIDKKNLAFEEVKTVMEQNNPYFIPRNNWVEKALDDASNDNNIEVFNQILEAMKTPYQLNADLVHLQNFSMLDDENYTTYCGT
jgi:uncharacterized protein YdiU (UPF0061 family)